MVPFEPLDRDFYNPSAEAVAPLLLGHYLLRRTPEGICGGEIVETEAYTVGDPACHAYLRQTPRNQSMWGEPGRAYVYRIYGLYFCFNAVCQAAGVAEAVLVRAVEPTVGLGIMQQFRTVTKERDLTNGPAKFCLAMDIDLRLDGLDICSLESPLFIARNPDREAFLQARQPLVTSTRIGITQAADWPFRWYLGGSNYISKRGPVLSTI